MSTTNRTYLQHGQPVNTALSKLAEEINREHESAGAALRSSLEHARRAGELLNEAKRQIPHGAWGGWIEQHFRGSVRTAQAYMRIASRWQELPANAQTSALSIDAALRLIAEPRDECEALRERVREVSDPARLQAEADRVAPGFVTLHPMGVVFNRQGTEEEFRAVGSIILAAAAVYEEWAEIGRRRFGQTAVKQVA